MVYYAVHDRQDGQALTLFSVAGERGAGARIWAVNSQRWAHFEGAPAMLAGHEDHYRAQRLSLTAAGALAGLLGIPWPA